MQYPLSSFQVVHLKPEFGRAAIINIINHVVMATRT
jgi:hypothetical protein